MQKIGATSSSINSELLVRNIKNNANNNFNMFSEYYKNDESKVQSKNSVGTFVINDYLQNKLLNSSTEVNKIEVNKTEVNQEEASTGITTTKSTTLNRNVDREYVENQDDLGEVIVKFLPWSTLNEQGGVVNSKAGGSISYAKNFDPENPVIVVRGEDSQGYYEATVEIKKINPKNCTAYEYEALNGYFTSQTGANFLPMNFPEKSPHDPENRKETFNLVEGYKNAISMGMFSKQENNYDIHDALDYFKNLWDKEFSFN